MCQGQYPINGLYCDVIFLGDAGCQIFTSHPVFLAPCQLVTRLQCPPGRRGRVGHGGADNFNRLCPSFFIPAGFHRPIKSCLLRVLQI